LKKGSLCQVFELVRLPGSLTNKQTKKSWKWAWAEANVMITIFGDFRLFLADKKLAFFFNNNVMIQFFQRF
jgi:hypothetical protein